MNIPLIVLPLAAGAVVVGSAFASVPREDRRAQWPVLAGVVVLGVVVMAVLARRGVLRLPSGGQRIPGPGGAVIPLFPELKVA